LILGGNFLLNVGDLADIWNALFPPTVGTLGIRFVSMTMVVVGIWWIMRVAREPVRPMDEMTAGEVRRALVDARDLAPRYLFWQDAPRLFSDAQIAAKLDDDRSVVDACYANFQDQGIYGISEARRMLRSRWLRDILRGYYRNILGRPKDGLWDPQGYVHWGSMIWRATVLERPEVLRYVKRRMEQWAARGAT
jgi:hypothetical protein